jgi:hypothetical protein
LLPFSCRSLPSSSSPSSFSPILVITVVLVLYGSEIWVICQVQGDVQSIYTAWLPTFQAANSGSDCSQTDR